MSFPPCFNIGLDGFSVTVFFSEKKDNLRLRSKYGQMSSSASQFHNLGFYIDSDLGRHPSRRTVSRCIAIASSCTSSRQQRLLSFSRGLDRPLVARLWRLLVCWASCLSSTPQLVWYSDFVATTTCLTHSQYCTGCVCQNGSISNWRLWHTECWTVCRHRIWTNLFLYLACQVVAVCGRRSRCSCTQHIPQYRLSTAGRRLFPVAASIFWNTLPDDVHSAPSVSDRFLFHQSFSDI